MEKNLPYFKIGDTLNIPVQWIDEDTDQGVIINPDYVIACTILTSYGVKFFPDVTINPDQVFHAGEFTIHLPASVTETMMPCTATLDIKVSIGDEVKHSEDFSFIVKRSIT